MKLIVGLGNPPEAYHNTRHNIGRMAVEKLAEKKEALWKVQKKLQGDVAKSDGRLMLKPATFMNESGRSVHAAARIHHVLVENIWLLHDDSDLAFGNVRIAYNQRSAGHRGVQSVFDVLGTQRIHRVKIGIRPEGVQHRAENFVLKPFSRGEKKQLAGVLEKTVEMLECALNEGVEQAMNHYHQKKK